MLSLLLAVSLPATNTLRTGRLRVHHVQMKAVSAGTPYGQARARAARPLRAFPHVPLPPLLSALPLSLSALPLLSHSLSALPLLLPALVRVVARPSASLSPSSSLLAPLSVPHSRKEELSLLSLSLSPLCQLSPSLVVVVEWVVRGWVGGWGWGLEREERGRERAREEEVRAEGMVAGERIG